NPPYVRTEGYKPARTKITLKQLTAELKQKWIQIHGEKKPMDLSPKLVDFLGRHVASNLKGKKTNEKLKPERVYYRYVEEIGAWFYSLTNEKGEFEKPAALLLPGSILPGRFFGLPDDQR